MLWPINFHLLVLCSLIHVRIKCHPARQIRFATTVQSKLMCTCIMRTNLMALQNRINRLLSLLNLT